MLISKTTPKGMDYHIQELQTALHTGLLAAWGIDTSLYKAYGRCYRNKTPDGYIAENYEGSGEYKEVYWDDSLAALSFFGITDQARAQTGLGSEVNVHFIMFANLSTLYPTITHRADEELRGKVQSLIGAYGYGFSYVGTELWLDNVLREYAGSRRDNRLLAVDMHPTHCFRINLKLLYRPNKIC